MTSLDWQVPWLETFTPSNEAPPLTRLQLQGILKGEASLYRWPPVWLVWISLFLQIKTKIVSCHTADSKPVKQEVNGTVILLLLVFLGNWLPLAEERESWERFCPMRFCSWIFCIFKWGSVTHQMAVPVPSISCCVSLQLKKFAKRRTH